jgi:hypothetical protein
MDKVLTRLVGALELRQNGRLRARSRCSMRFRATTISSKRLDGEFSSRRIPAYRGASLLPLDDRTHGACHGELAEPSPRGIEIVTRSGYEIPEETLRKSSAALCRRTSNAILAGIRA